MKLGNKSAESVKGKMLLALDTNSIIKYFERLLHYRRGKHDKFNVPEECSFLKNNGDKMELFVSVLNQAEVFRNLKSEWGCSNGEIETMWNEFTSWLQLKIIDEVVIDGQILGVTKSVALKKKTIVNFIHLQVAKELGLWFYTGDKQIKEKGKLYYDKILGYVELREILAKERGEARRSGNGNQQPFALSLLIILSSTGPIFPRNSLVDIAFSGTKTLISLLFSLIFWVCIMLGLVLLQFISVSVHKRLGSVWLSRYAPVVDKLFKSFSDKSASSGSKGVFCRLSA